MTCEAMKLSCRGEMVINYNTSVILVYDEGESHTFYSPHPLEKVYILDSFILCCSRNVIFALSYVSDVLSIWSSVRVYCDYEVYPRGSVFFIHSSDYIMRLDPSRRVSMLETPCFHFQEMNDEHFSGHMEVMLEKIMSNLPVSMVDLPCYVKDGDLVHGSKEYHIPVSERDIINLDADKDGCVVLSNIGMVFAYGDNNGDRFGREFKSGERIFHNVNCKKVYLNTNYTLVVDEKSIVYIMGCFMGKYYPTSTEI